MSDGDYARNMFLRAIYMAVMAGVIATMLFAASGVFIVLGYLYDAAATGLGIVLLIGAVVATIIGLRSGWEDFQEGIRAQTEALAADE